MESKAIKWDLSQEHYPQIWIRKDHESGLSKWLEKIAGLTNEYDGEWNVLIADVWPNDNMTRFIGHVQMDDVAVGYDTGFRVCAYLENGRILGRDRDKAVIRKWLLASTKAEKTRIQLRGLAQQNAFEIRLTKWGDGPIKMSKGFVYLVAVMDWYSRKVL